VVIHKKPGDRVEEGELVLELLYNHDRGVADALSLASEAAAVADLPPPPRPLVVGSVRPRS
jgi:hypothetical protein